MDTTKFTPAQMNTLRRVFHAMNHFMVFMWKIGLGRWINAWPAVGGRMMVIQHRGRRSGKIYLTPVNYASVDGEVYCLAGFGSTSDWYRNALADPHVELWLPDNRHAACVEDVSESSCRLSLMRAVIIASGFAAPLFGIHQKKLNDEQLNALTRDYRLLHFRLEN